MEKTHLEKMLQEARKREVEQRKQVATSEKDVAYARNGGFASLLKVAEQTLKRQKLNLDVTVALIKDLEKASGALPLEGDRKPLADHGVKLPLSGRSDPRTQS